MIINLTSRAITVQLAGGKVTLPTSGIVATAVRRETPALPVAGLPTCIVDYDGVRDLPGPEDGKSYLVTRLVARTAQRWGRTTDDLLVAGHSVLDADGRSMGCLHLERVT